MKHPSDPPDSPAPSPQSNPPAEDNAWLQALLFPDGSALLDYGDGTLLIDEAAPYDKR